VRINHSNPYWDIFCRIIDNYGDIAVTWRLARILTEDYQQTVRLWVDDLIPLKSLCPDINPQAHTQVIHRIILQHWTPQTQATDCADIVVEAFGCELPTAYLDAMQRRKPIWINLDYFSAEPWVTDFHGLPSTQANGLQKMVFLSKRATQNRRVNA
jgi:uncharacterized repeat protein (TIGR03837 family)